ncbi:Transcription factor like [Actinidia chinensis var. chinensis]|uniref:Transcription factor like n=1 Tax=Actinidia chinensis var. chinensis TaxID=1590841 RepID=A0A2R6Q8T7_ACTCC|nr:Transcription factor like [Actinidia chinensis var. chinensis]
MRNPSSLKQEILKKWVMGLQICSSSTKEMTILERKKAIKLSADIAMASARNASNYWSRALISNASKKDENKALLDHILGCDLEKIKKKSSIVSIKRKKIVLRSKKILKKRVKNIGVASYIAKRLVKKRTQLLKRLVPGGESMDELSLMEETLDYIVSLRAQVDVMRHLANASMHLDHKVSSSMDQMLL